MILLITPSARGQQCADSLRTATGEETHWAETLQEAATRLREQTYSAAVIDQFLLETEPEESDTVIEHFGTAFPVYINFAVTGMERLVREARAAVLRRRTDAQRDARNPDRNVALLPASLVGARRSLAGRGKDPRYRWPGQGA